MSRLVIPDIPDDIWKKHLTRGQGVFVERLQRDCPSTAAMLLRDDE
jgi:hypothetical protein